MLYKTKNPVFPVHDGHVDDLVQPVPKYSPKQIERRIKSIRAKKKIEGSPEVKKMLREGNCGQGVLRGEGRSTRGREGDTTLCQETGKETRKQPKTQEGKQLELFSYHAKA